MWVQSLRHIHTCQGKNYSFELARALQPQVSKVEMNATNMVALHSMMGMMAHMARNEQGHPCYSKNLTTHCASWNLTILRINWSYIQNMWRRSVGVWMWKRKRLRTSNLKVAERQTSNIFWPRRATHAKRFIITLQGGTVAFGAIGFGNNIHHQYCQANYEENNCQDLSNMETQEIKRQNKCTAESCGGSKMNN